MRELPAAPVLGEGGIARQILHRDAHLMAPSESCVAPPSPPGPRPLIWADVAGLLQGRDSSLGCRYPEALPELGRPTCLLAAPHEILNGDTPSG